VRGAAAAGGEEVREAIGTYPPLVNIGAGKDLTIRELAELVCEVVGFKGRLEFDGSKPDGTPRKLLDTTRMEKLGWRSRIGFRGGVRMAYEPVCYV
jgi:GDP-L-fucose synthase